MTEENPIEKESAASPRIPISLRMPLDVLRFFRETGRGWQTLMISVLREYMQRKR